MILRSAPFRSSISFMVLDRPRTIMRQLVELEGSGSEAEVRAALERVRQQVSWLTASSSGIGQGTFSAQLRMVCTVPPRATPGICAAPSPTR